MTAPGVWEEKELKLLLKKQLENKDEVFNFAVAASGPREGRLVLDKTQKLKKNEVLDAAEAEIKKNGGKPSKLDVMTGKCYLDANNAATLRIVVNGKAPAKAVSCVEYLLTKGPFKSIGFLGVILEEVEEVSTAGQTPPSETAPPAPLAPPAPNPEALRFAQRLKLLKPNMEKVLAATVPATPATKATFATASQTFKQQNFVAAHEALDQLEPLIKKGMEELASKALADGDPAARFKERLMSFLAALKGVAETPVGKAAKVKASEAGVFATKKDFEQANALLDQALAALHSSAGETGDQPTFEPPLARIEAKLLRAQKANPDARTALGNLWNFALAQSQAGDEQRANQAFERLEKAIDEVLAKAAKTDTDRFGIQEGLVADMKEKILKARKRWDDGIKSAQVELNKVQDGIRESDPELADALVEIIQGYQHKLRELLQAAESADAGNHESERIAALDMTTQLIQMVSTDDLLVHLDAYPEASIKLQDTILTALSEIETHLSI